MPSFFLHSKKTESRRFVSESKHPVLYKLVHKLYEDGKVASITGSFPSNSFAQKHHDLVLVDENFIKSVTAVRYDRNIFNNVSFRIYVLVALLIELTRHRTPLRFSSNGKTSQS